MVYICTKASVVRVSFHLKVRSKKCFRNLLHENLWCIIFFLCFVDVLTTIKIYIAIIGMNRY